MSALRIVQVLNGETARAVMRAAKLYTDGAFVGPVVLDSDGRFWRWGADNFGDLRLDWHRLPLPPLPEQKQL